MNLKTLLTKIATKRLSWADDPKNFKKNHSLIWQNPREKSNGGLRLTDQGYQIFSNDLDMKSYTINFPDKEFMLTNQIMIWLDRFIDSPYYINKNSIVVFKEKTAVQLILFNGDVKKYGLIKAMQTRENLS